MIVHCINEIEKRGLDTKDLYKASGSEEEANKLKDQFHKVVPNLSNVDIHVLCDCLKNFIRMQEKRLISQNDFSKLVDVLEKNNESLYECVMELPSINRNILAFLILHLQKYFDWYSYLIKKKKCIIFICFYSVINSPKCCMDYESLAIVFGPIFVNFSNIGIDDLHIETKRFFKVSFRTNIF